MFSIGILSKKARVKIPTIRYYEQAGLLETPSRTEGNQRRYSQKDLEQLCFIRHARELGFSIEDIQALIKLNGHPDQPCTDATRIANNQLLSIRSKITRLKALESELERISTGCSSDNAQDCYVLTSLSDHQFCSTKHI